MIMKKVFVMSAAVLLFFVSSAFAQEISQNEVPSVIVNNFQQAFPKASDVEWEKKVNSYKVEFETGIFEDEHEVWYDKTGKMLRHKEEISRRAIPKAIITAIKNDFNGYKIDDVDKTTEGDAVTYKVDLEKPHSELKVIFDANGKVLSQKRD